MKKFLLLPLLTVCLIPSTFAATGFIPFTTVEEATQYCPAITSLTFKPNNLLPKSAGKIVGNNRIVFESIPTKTAIHPKNMDANGKITDAEFRSADGLYGYISNNVITCLYTYETFTNASYPLVMRGA